jgi:hypothetical protein
MKIVVMEETAMIIFPKAEDGKGVIVPYEYEYKTTESGINYLIKEEDASKQKE